MQLSPCNIACLTAPSRRVRLQLQTRYSIDGMVARGNRQGHSLAVPPLANVTQCNVVGAPGNPKRRPEGKLVCNPESLFGAKDCVVVSVGCQNDYRFEEYLYRTTSCRVEVFLTALARAEVGRFQSGFALA